MRIGLTLHDETALELARAADRYGVPVLRIPSAPIGTASGLAAEVAAVTTDARLVVPVVLGVENPVTLAEEIAVLDRVSAGRVIVVIEPGELDAAAAAEDLALLRDCWTGSWVEHHGERWTVPAGLHGESSPSRIAVTPLPAQLELSVWLDEAAEPHGSGLPRFASRPSALASGPGLRLGADVLSGSLDDDRETVLEWARAGAGLLLVPTASGWDDELVERYLARYLIPEASTPSFPRIVAESAWPVAWPPR